MRTEGEEAGESQHIHSETDEWGLYTLNDKNVECPPAQKYYESNFLRMISYNVNNFVPSKISGERIFRRITCENLQLFQNSCSRIVLV